MNFAGSNIGGAGGTPPHEKQGGTSRPLLLTQRKEPRHLKQYTDPVAAFFDFFNRRTGRDMFFWGYLEGHLSNNLDLTGSNNIAVDLGCGTGWLTTLLARQFGTVYGIDPSHPMLRLAWDNIVGKFPNIKLYDCPPEKIKGECSFVSAVHVHYHFETREKLRDEFFKAASELLKPGGEFVLVGCPSDHINDSPEHYYNMVSIEDIPDAVKEAAPQLSFMHDAEGYVSLHDLPQYALKDGTQMKVVFTTRDDNGKDRSVVLTDTFWSDNTLIEVAKEVGLELTNKANLNWRDHPDAYMVMRFRKMLPRAATVSD